MKIFLIESMIYTVPFIEIRNILEKVFFENILGQA